MVSNRAKKKLADRTCLYCSKEFRYPCRLAQHMKAKNKCNNSMLTVDDSFLPVNNNVSTVNDSVLPVNNSISTVNGSILTEKNTVPVRLTLL